MKLSGLLVAVATVVAAARPAMAEEPPGLAPSSAWNLHYDTDSCALRRVFGEGENRIYLELRRFEPGVSLQVVVASSRMKPENPADFKFRFDGAADWSDVSFAPTMTLGGGFRGVLFSSALIDLPEYDQLEDGLDAYLRTIDYRAAEQAFAAKTRNLTLRGAFSKTVALQLGSMTRPVEALNQCVDELLYHWGIDVEAHKSLTRPALPINLPEIPRMIDYPPKMVQRSMPGVVNIRLGIDETGRITGCHIQMPLSDPAFEESSCANIQHALEFEPALDKDGKPIPSYWVTKVIFQIRQ